MDIKNNKLFLYIFLVSIAIIILMMYLSRNCYFGGDDALYSIYKPNQGCFDCLFGKTRFDHGGYYIGWALCKFFSFGLPNLLSFHPADFIGTGHGAVKGIFAITVLLLITKFSTFYTKSKLIFSSVFLFSASYFFYNAINSNVIIINYNFYRYFFSFIFFSIFWYYIMRIYTWYIYRNILLYVRFSCFFDYILQCYNQFIISDFKK